MFSMNPNFDYNINDSDESDESDDMEGFGEIKIHPAGTPYFHKYIFNNAFRR